MAKTTYCKESFEEFLIRLTSQTLTMIIIGMLFLTLYIIREGEKEISVLEERLEVNYTLNYYERKPIEEMLREYVNSLPLPQSEISQVEEENLLVEEVSTQQTIAYDEKDIELLARLMYAEEGIFIYKLSEEEAKYVNQLAGSVVIHRRNTNHGGAQTIEDVVFADGQYDCVSKGNIYQDIPDIEYEWAEELLRDGPIGPDNLVYQAEFPQGSEVYDQIGNQYFCLK